MTSSLPTTVTAATIPQWTRSISSSPSTSSLDDHDFLDRLLFLKPEDTTEPQTAKEQATNEVVRGRLINLDADLDHPTGDIHYDRKPSLHDLISSSQPTTLLPTNALHLHLDDPSALLATPCETPYADAPYNHLPPRARVRFRSRVRITSGFSRHRRGGDLEDFSSTRSSSPSSSISAPLRSHTENSTTAWGTLGRRVGLLSLQKKIISSPRQKKRIRPIAQNENADERTPLRNSFNYAAYGEGGDEEENDDDRLSHEVDEIFGKFPGRLLNRHWWWWQIEPFICCYYATDFE